MGQLTYRNTGRQAMEAGSKTNTEGRQVMESRLYSKANTETERQVMEGRYQRQYRDRKTDNGGQVAKPIQRQDGR